MYHCGGFVFFIFLRGGFIFRGGGEINIVFCVRGWLLGVYLNELFVCEVGVLQGVVERNGRETNEGVIIEGISVFLIWMKVGHLFCGGGEFRVVVRAWGWGGWGFLGC